MSFQLGISSRGSCHWSSEISDYGKQIITIAHAVNSVSGLALVFCYDLALDFGLDYIKLANLVKQCSCTVCVHITAELVCQLFVCILLLLAVLLGHSFFLPGDLLDRLDNLGGHLVLKYLFISLIYIIPHCGCLNMNARNINVWFLIICCFHRALTGWSWKQSF